MISVVFIKQNYGWAIVCPEVGCVTSVNFPAVQNEILMTTHQAVDFFVNNQQYKINIYTTTYFTYPYHSPYHVFVIFPKLKQKLDRYMSKLEFSLNVFTEFAELTKYLSVKGLEPTTQPPLV